MIQLESLEGMYNLDAILTEVPEIDAVWIGLIDARVSMGLPGGHGIRGTEPEWLAAVDHVLATVRKHNKPFSGFCLGKSGEEFRKATDHMSMCIIGGDTIKLAEMMDELKDARASSIGK